MVKRVVITGIGIVSPVGNNREEAWINILDGNCGIDQISIFDATTFPCRIAAEVKNFDFTSGLENKKLKKYVSRSIAFALGATKEALSDAGISRQNTDFQKVSVSYGNSGQRDFIEDFTPILNSIQSNFKEIPFVSVGDFLKNKYHSCAEVISMNNEFGGAVYSLSTACATGTQAIGNAFNLIRSGDAEVVVAGGCDSMINEIDLMSFCLLGAVTTSFNDNPKKASRPFSKDRSGFVLGEGATTLICESLEHALKRKARIYGEIIGYGSTTSNVSLTDPPMDGSAAYSSMLKALKVSKLKTEEVDYINMHGTSTKDNDYTESLSVKKLFGNKIITSSTKSTTGHLISGAGALESAVCLLAIRDNVVPPTINLDNQDGQCELDYTPNNKRFMPVSVALSNSLGFGGSNASVIFKEYIYGQD